MAILTGPLEGEALTAIEGVELDRLVELLWRPDGSGFTFHADNPKRWVDLDLDGSAREWGGLDNVPILKTGAAYSPSGRWICANDRHDLWLIAAGGGRITRLKDWDDQDSWKQFFDTYSELILNVARKAGLRDAEAHEVVQETVISVSKSIGQFKTGSEHGSFKSWLLNTTRWRIMDQFRKRRKLEGYVQSIPGTVGDEREGGRERWNVCRAQTGPALRPRGMRNGRNTGFKWPSGVCGRRFEPNLSRFSSSWWQSSSRQTK